MPILEVEINKSVYSGTYIVAVFLCLFLLQIVGNFFYNFGIWDSFRGAALNNTSIGSSGLLIRSASEKLTPMHRRNARVTILSRSALHLFEKRLRSLLAASISDLMYFSPTEFNSPKTSKPRKSVFRGPHSTRKF